MRIETLEWDSDFFECKVGRALLKGEDKISLDELDDFELVYLIIENNLTEDQKKYFESFSFFADEKLTYTKKIGANKNLKEGILSWPAEKQATTGLLQIGVASGEYSRFKIDPMIPYQKFEELYQTWIINSVKRTIAKEVYYTTDGGMISGLITLGIKNGRPDIGILSVHEKFRGKQIATGLVNAAEYWSANVMDSDQLQVVTQAANKGACQFYEKCGFLVDKREFIFHWWKSKKI